MGICGGFGVRLEYKWFIRNKLVNLFIYLTYLLRFIICVIVLDNKDIKINEIGFLLWILKFFGRVKNEYYLF